MSLKILLADDSMTAQNMGRKILADAGYEVVAVSNGAAAIKKIAETRPDLIILDIYMPGYTGLEVCERVRGKAETAKTPVLLSVGKLEPYLPEEGAKVKADGVIVKPFEASELLAVVKRFEEKLGVSSPAADLEKTVLLQKPPVQEFKDETYVQWKSATEEAPAAENEPAPPEAQAPAPFHLEAAEPPKPFTMDVMPAGGEQANQPAAPQPEVPAEAAPAPMMVPDFTGYSSEIDPALLEIRSAPAAEGFPSPSAVEETAPSPMESESPAESGDLGAMMMSSLMEMIPLPVAGEETAAAPAPEVSIEPESPEPELSLELPPPLEFATEAPSAAEPAFEVPEASPVAPVMGFAPVPETAVPALELESKQGGAPDLVGELFASLTETNAMMPGEELPPPQELGPELQLEPGVQAEPEAPAPIEEPPLPAAISKPSPEVAAPVELSALEITPVEITPVEIPPVEASVAEAALAVAPPVVPFIETETRGEPAPLTLEELDAMLGISLPMAPEPEPAPESAAAAAPVEDHTPVLAAPEEPAISEVVPVSEVEIPLRPVESAPAFAVESPVEEAVAPEPVAPSFEIEPVSHEEAAPAIAAAETAPDFAPLPVESAPAVERQEDHEFAAAMSAALDSLGVESLPAAESLEHEAAEVSGEEPPAGEVDYGDIAGVVQRVFDRYKPQMIADIARELTHGQHK